jgi:hypothetical protein
VTVPPIAFLGSPYLQDPDLTIWNGDVREVLRSLPDESVQMCVTSPPYWGLRDYGTEGQIGLEPYPDAHFATFPTELARRCIVAGTSERGCCRECGAPWVRVVEVESSWRSRSEGGATRGNLAPEGLVGAGTQRAVHGAGVSHDLDSRRRDFKGWEPSCKCGERGSSDGSLPAPCTILDPFFGSGTTGDEEKARDWPDPSADSRLDRRRD